MAIFAACAGKVFVIAFGAQWEQAGHYATIMTPLFLTLLIFRPLAGIFDLFEKQREQGIFNVVMLVITVGVLMTAGSFCEPKLTVAAYATATTLMMVSRLVWLLELTGVNSRRILSVVWRPILLSVILSHHSRDHEAIVE